ASHADRNTVTSSNGEFSFRGLEPDRYSITASLGGFRSATVEAVVTRNATVDLSLVIHIPTPSDQKAVNAPAPPPPPPAPMAAPMTAAERAFESASAIGAAGGVAGGFNTEAYDRITDNQWTRAAEQPLSTFSTDVDTASYSNVRRFLRQGQAPPK